MIQPTNNKILVEVLVKVGLIAEDQIADHVDAAKKVQQPLLTYLINNHVLTNQQILEALSKELSLEIVDLKRMKISDEIVGKVPVKFTSYYKFMPIGIEDNVLTLAVSAPLELRVQDEIRVHLGFESKTVLALEKDIEEALKKYYGLASDTIEKILTKDPNKRKKYEEGLEAVEDIEMQSDDPSVTKLVNQIILEAYQKRATDIHIEPYRDKVRIRYRIDGVLVDANLPADVKHFLLPMLSRIKIMSNLSITEKRLPQDGSAVVKTKDQNLDLRVSTIPTPRGESMVIRILPTNTTLLDLERLGFNQNNAETFRNLIKKPHGVLFVTGPTGSGKTTTLYACLHEINAPERKIISIEDPIEYEMEGVTQIQINSKMDFGFAEGLRSVLRHDPDILMVGEVRDLETAEIAIRTALTGHLVFSTLHTNDAASGITRLIDMGVEPYLVASSVEAFIAQRLVRVICPHCKEEDQRPLTDIRDEISSVLQLNSADDVKIYKGAGCDQCNGTGYYGRTAIYEILLLDEDVRAAIIDKPRAESIKRLACSKGMQTLREDGWKNVIKGVTTPDEVMNVTVKEDFGWVAGEQVSAPVAERPQAPKAQQVAAEKKEKADGPFVSNKPSVNKPNASGRTEYEFRAYPRIEEVIQLKYLQMEMEEDKPNFLRTVGDEVDVFSVDISAGGVKFLSKESLNVGGILELKIFLEQDQEPIQCISKVSRVEEDNFSDQFMVSVYYMDISGTDRSRLIHFAKSHLANTVQ